MIAARALKDESMKVYHALKAGDIGGARIKLSYIVGRDTQNLDEGDIAKAAVETVAENLSDGVIAPLIFIFIGGAPLGMAYKAINTLDSMIGYRNGEFEYFGKFAARLDDVANWVPSRVSALLALLYAAIKKGCNDNGIIYEFDVKRAFRIYRRDKNNHKSPNSAQTESVFAGALGLQLGGESFYGGAQVLKPAIGDDIKKPEAYHIAAANRLMYASAAFAAIFLAAAGVIIGI
jgi:adenosylcobinamide-phosphate synthase